MTDTAHKVADGSQSLYENDFFAWTVQQAAALRRGAQAGTDPALDWETLAEEVESMGRSERRALDSALLRIIEHLLKLEYSPAVPLRRGWEESVNAHRMDAIHALRDSPSLRRQIELAQIHEDALIAARLGLSREGINPAALPETCPYTLDRLLDREWWPENRFGIRP
jgi:hypothetical protein